MLPMDIKNSNTYSLKTFTNKIYILPLEWQIINILNDTHFNPLLV